MIDAVFDLAPISVVLPLHARRVRAALGHAGFIDAANGVGMSMLCRDDLLTAIAELVVIPHDRLEQSLQRARNDILIECHGLDILPRDLRQQPAHINKEQVAPGGPRETVFEAQQKSTELFCETSNIQS